MRRLWGLACAALLVAGIGWVSPPTASACSCALLSIAEIVDAADVVVVGTPGGRYTERDEGREVVGHAIEVSAVYKGRMPARALLWTATEGDSCGMGLTDGEEMLLVASREQGRLRTSLCQGSRTATNAVTNRLEAVAGPGVAPPAGEDPTLSRLEDDRHRRRLLWAGPVGLLLGAGAGLLLERRRRRADPATG